jgi:hypothetical protein
MSYELGPRWAGLLEGGKFGQKTWPERTECWQLKRDQHHARRAVGPKCRSVNVMLASYLSKKSQKSQFRQKASGLSLRQETRLGTSPSGDVGRAGSASCSGL